MDPITAFLAAKHTLSQILDLIDAIAARREEKRRQKALRRQTERRFLHEFMHAWAPEEDSKEDETIRSRCKKLQNVIKTHWQFIADKGPLSAQVGHARIANTMFHMAAFPGLPAASATPNAVAERLVGTYSDAQNELSNVINRLEAAQGYEVRELILRIEKVDKNVKTGFAVGANVQAEFDARNSVAASSWGFQPNMLPPLDEVTSQINVEDLVESQTSPEALKASYSRVEHRCVQSISRNVSPATTQPSISPSSTSSMYYSQEAFAAIQQKLMPFASSCGGEQTWDLGQNLGTAQNVGVGGPGGPFGMYMQPTIANTGWRNPWG